MYCIAHYGPFVQCLVTVLHITSRSVLQYEKWYCEVTVNPNSFLGTIFLILFWVPECLVIYLYRYQTELLLL